MIPDEGQSFDEWRLDFLDRLDRLLEAIFAGDEERLARLRKLHEQSVRRSTCEPSTGSETLKARPPHRTR